MDLMIEAEAHTSRCRGKWDEYVKQHEVERRLLLDDDRPTIDGEHFGVRYWIEWGRDHTGASLS